MIWEEIDLESEGEIGKSNDSRVSRWTMKVTFVAINWDVKLRWEGGYGGWWESERLTTSDSILSLSWYLNKDVLH